MSLLDKYQAGDNKELLLKQEISEILRAYRHPWDIFAESLQNSVDAINTRFRVLNDPSYYRYDEIREAFGVIEGDPEYKGKIDIYWDLNTNKIRFIDNGIGIPSHKLEDYVLPKGTGKKLGKDYGFSRPLKIDSI